MSHFENILGISSIGLGVTKKEVIYMIPMDIKLSMTAQS